MSSYIDLLAVLDVTDPSQPLTAKQLDTAERIKIFGLLEDLTQTETRYYTAGRAAALRDKANTVKAKLDSLKTMADTRTALAGLESKERTAALNDMSRAATNLRKTSRRITNQITPEYGRVQQLVVAGGTGKTPAMILQEFVSNHFLDEPGVRMSDEKMHATLLELSRRGFFQIDESGRASSEELKNTGVLTSIQNLLNETGPAYREAKAQIDQANRGEQTLERGIRAMQQGQELSQEERSQIVREVSEGVSQIETGIGSIGDLRAQQDKLLEEDAALKELSTLRKQLQEELKISPTSKNKYAKIIADPKFQTWAEMHGYDLGVVDVDKDGNPVLSSYKSSPDDDRAILHFAAQSRTGLDLRADRVGRMVRLSGTDAATVDPLTDRDVPEAERAIVSGLRAGTITAFRFGDGPDDGVFVDTQSGKVYGMIPGPDGSDILGLLDEDSTQFVLGEMRDPKNAQLTAERSKAGQSDADALMQKYPVSKQQGEQEYREIKPNARDISRGKIRLQSVATGEIIERDLDGYRDTIEVVEDFSPDLGSKIRAGRDRRLERRGRKAAGVELMGKDDQDPTGSELASMRKREGEGGLQDQLDAARKELEAAQSAYPGRDPEADLRSTDPTTREQAARVLRAQRSIEQLDAKVAGSLSKAGTRVEEAVGDEPALDVVPVFEEEAQTEQLKQEDGEPVETGAQLLEASAAEIKKPASKPVKTPVDDTLIDVPPPAGAAAAVKAARASGVEEGTQAPDYGTRLERFQKRMALFEGKSPERLARQEERVSKKEERAKAAQERAKAAQQRLDREVGGLGRNIASMESTEDREVAVKRADSKIARLMKRKSRAEGRAEGREEAAQSASERLEKPEMEGEKNIKLRERDPSQSAGGKVVTPPKVRAEAVRPGEMKNMLIKTGEKRGEELGPTIMSEEDLREFRKRVDEDPDLGEVEGLGKTKDPEEIKRRLKRIQEMRDASLDRYTERIKAGTNTLPLEEAPDVNQILGLGK